MDDSIPAADLEDGQNELVPVLGAIGKIFQDVIEPKILKDQWQHAIDTAEIDKFICLVPTTCRGLKSQDDQTFANVTKALADGSRSEPWRSALGNTLVLEFYLGLLSEGGDYPWTIDALRLVGNCCIDIDANRDRTLKTLDMVHLLNRVENNGPQADVALGVLYNLCLDYEPAQKAARDHGLYLRILQMFRNGNYSNPNQISQLCTLLDFAVEEVDLESSPEDAIKTIYQVLATADIEIDESLSLCNSISSHLSSERYQKLTIARGEVSLITALFVFSYTHRRSTLRANDVPPSLQVDARVEETDQEQAVFQLRSTLIARLWDLSARSEINLPGTHTPDLIRILHGWLLSGRTQMQLCACSMLRNIAASHSMTVDMIENTHVNVALVSLMTYCSDVQSLEEALRLYRNLAIHPDYKILLTDYEAFDVVTGLWSKFPVQIVQYAATRVVRQLLTGEATNVKRFIASLSHLSEDSRTKVSYIDRLNQLYSTTNDLATKMEVGQIVLAVWRTCTQQRTTKTQPDYVTADEAINRARAVGLNIAAPVMGLITASNNPCLKTQGWLGLALMAGSQEGSLTVAEVIDDDAGENLAIFQQTLLEKETDGAPTKDANNACILLTLLKKNHPDLSPQIARLRASSGLIQGTSQITGDN